MTLDIFLISASVALLVLSGTLIALFITLRQTMAELRELTPVIADIRTISLNAAMASESLCLGFQQISRVSEALGNIGDDLEEGRRAVKGTVETVNQLVSPLLGLLKWFQKK